VPGIAGSANCARRNTACFVCAQNPVRSGLQRQSLRVEKPRWTAHADSRQHRNSHLRKPRRPSKARVITQRPQRRNVREARSRERCLDRHSDFSKGPYYCMRTANRRKFSGTPTLLLERARRERCSTTTSSTRRIAIRQREFEHARRSARWSLSNWIRHGRWRPNNPKLRQNDRTQSQPRQRRMKNGGLLLNGHAPNPIAKNTARAYA